MSETPKAVTPFGGLISFVVYLVQIGFGLGGQGDAVSHRYLK